jgi:hypothetical protein
MQDGELGDRGNLLGRAPEHVLDPVELASEPAGFDIELRADVSRVGSGGLSCRENHWSGFADHHTVASINVVTHADKADDLQNRLGTSSNDRVGVRTRALTDGLWDPWRHCAYSTDCRATSHEAKRQSSE